jgi:hypothetical protein
MVARASLLDSKGWEWAVVALSVDAWERPFEVICDAGKLAVRSNGSDRQPGTDDDIIVPVSCGACASGRW